MSRLPCLAVAVLLVLTGCAGLTSPAGNDTSTTTTPEAIGSAEFRAIDSVTVAPGEHTTATITAKNVGEFHIAGVGPDNVSVSAESLHPRPDQIATTMPAYYSWDEVQPSVQVVLSVDAASDAQSGTYQFDVLAWNDTNHSHANGTTGTLTVTVSEE